jgi:short-subunit dehydrogenase
MDERKATRPLAVVTGASSGIGYHLAKQAAEHGYDLVVAADMPLADAVQDFEALGARVDPIECDLATRAGVEQLLACVAGRRVDALLANAGHGLGGAFTEQGLDEILHVINTNITGTVHLIHDLARQMAQQGSQAQPARVLVTGSIAGFQPGAFHAVYNGTKAFVDSFTMAIRNELKDQPITFTLLMPGATDTEFFHRANMETTKVANDPKMMMQPEEVARIGFEAMLKGEPDVVAGWKNRMQVAMSKVLPSQATAEMHRKLAEPGKAPDMPLQKEERS